MEGMYFADFARLKARFSLTPGRVALDDRVDAVVLPFRSDAPELRLHGPGTPGPLDAVVPSLAVPDWEVPENTEFTYPVMLPSGVRRAASAILLFHGLNEKSWDKYLPWARQLCLRTGKAVVLFPIAFHMNRAPAQWSNPREMSRAAAERRRMLGPIESASFANVALSTRLESRPERFILSGLETFDDVVRLVGEIRAGRHPCIDAGAPIDLFGYSIGAFLAEVLVMSNPRRYFRSSRAFLFCGGSTLRDMAPVSKFILDGKAGETLSSFFQGRFEEELARESPLARLFARIQSLGTVFRSFLDHERLRSFREARLAGLGRRIKALALARDIVVPGAGVQRTLENSVRGGVQVIDFPFPYTHENPFPLLEGMREEISLCFDGVFTLAGDFLA